LTEPGRLVHASGPFPREERDQNDMGRGDNRRTMKMRRRKAQAKLKLRLKKRREQGGG
jgi:hypothetical protein